jgi:ribonuclease HI
MDSRKDCVMNVSRENGNQTESNGRDSASPADPPENTAVVIYTDGASSGNPGPSGIGIVMAYKGRKKEISRHIGNSTNNIAELEAIRTALSALKTTHIPVRLYTDSAYAVGLLQQGWRARKNQELVEEIRTLLKRFRDIRIIKVAGHSGVPENEQADRLATTAVRNGGQSEG